MTSQETDFSVIKPAWLPEGLYDLWLEAYPARIPTNNADIGPRNPAPGVIVANPEIIPLATPNMVGFP